MLLLPKTTGVPCFIQKLWEILETPGTETSLKWTENGRSFVVVEKQSFCKQILPKYFKHTNFCSFVRQLNMYNFRKLRTSHFENEFSHPLFRRHQRSLLIGIRRKPSQAEVEYGNQLLAQLGLDDVKKESEEVTNRSTTQEVVLAQLKQPEAPSQLQTIKEEYKILWEEYQKTIQKHNLAIQKVWNFFNSGLLSGKYGQALNSNGINCFLNHLNSEEPALTSEQYGTMLSYVPNVQAWVTLPQYYQVVVKPHPVTQ